MGEVLKKIYEIVEHKAGLQARIKLVQRTGISKDKAAMVEEDEEMIKGFKALAREITGIDVDQLRL
ncbi:MAG TPA: hypothetical protein VF336_06030 [Syntrophales bacterium]|jgi:hypothetical protein